MNDVSGLVQILLAGGLLALIGTLLSLRTGRQKSYDDRVDKELERLRQENHGLELDNDLKSIKLADAQEELTRLRVLLRSHGIDPESRPHHG